MLELAASQVELAASQVELAESQAELAESQAERDRLLREQDCYQNKIRNLELMIVALKQKLFGNGQGEKIDKNQLLLDLQQAEFVLECTKAQQQSEDEENLESKVNACIEQTKKEESAETKRVRRYSLPDDIEEIEEIITPDEVKANPEAYKQVGNPAVTVIIDIIAAKFVKRRIVRPRFVRIDDRSQAPIVAPTPKRVISGGLPAVGLLVYIILSKYVDHLPLYRMEQIFKTRYEVEISRKTMGGWIRAVAEDWLSIIYYSIKSDLQKSPFLHADETPIVCLDHDSPKGSRKGYLWVYVSNEGDVLYDWRMGRSCEDASSMLEGYTGLLQTDGYVVYSALNEREKKKGKEGFTLICCMAHLRRKFYEAWNDASEIESGWYILHIKELYEIERDLKEDPTLDIVQTRKSRSVPILDKIKTQLDADSLTLAPSSKTRQAVNYALNVWEAMCRYIEHAEAKIDNNAAEQVIRPTKLGMKNWLFVGHPVAGQRSAILYTLMQNCKTHNIDPRAYLVDVLTRLPHMTNNPEEIRSLHPKNWKPQEEIIEI